jgi:hypothetical protein
MRNTAGDTSWATHLNALRDCLDPGAVAAATSAIRSRLTISAGGTVDDQAPEWRDAPRLFAR